MVRKILKYLLYLSPILGIFYADRVIIRFIVKMLQLNIIANNKENVELFGKLHEYRGVIYQIFAVLSWNTVFSFLYLVDRTKVFKE